MKIWTKINCLLSSRRSTCAGCGHVVTLIGAAPENPAEELITRVAGGRTELPLEWLEQKVRRELYTRELHQGGHVLDIGLFGPDLFCKEATRLLSMIRPEFGFIREAASPDPLQDKAGLAESKA